MKEKVKSRDRFAVMQARGPSLLSLAERRVIATKKVMEEAEVAVSRCQYLIDEQSILLEGWKQRALEAHLDFDAAVEALDGKGGKL